MIMRVAKQKPGAVSRPGYDALSELICFLAKRVT